MKKTIWGQHCNSIVLWIPMAPSLDGQNISPVRRALIFPNHPVLGDTSPGQTLRQHRRPAVCRRPGCLCPQSHWHVQQRKGICPIPSLVWMQRPRKICLWPFLCWRRVSGVIFKGWVEQEKNEPMSDQGPVGFVLRASCSPVSRVAEGSSAMLPRFCSFSCSTRRVSEMLAIEPDRRDCHRWNVRIPELEAVPPSDSASHTTHGCHHGSEGIGVRVEQCLAVKHVLKRLVVQDSDVNIVSGCS